MLQCRHLIHYPSELLFKHVIDNFLNFFFLTHMTPELVSGKKVVGETFYLMKSNIGDLIFWEYNLYYFIRLKIEKKIIQK